MVKACVFPNEEETIALIAIDALHMENELRNEIAKRISRYTDIPEKNVLVAAVHSHTGIPSWKHICDDEEVNYKQASKTATLMVQLYNAHVYQKHPAPFATCP